MPNSKLLPALFGLLLVLASCGKTTNCINFDNIDTLTVCPTIYNPVCGCDDNTYPNDCYARKSGVVSWIGGPCP